MAATMFAQRFARYFSTRDRGIMTIEISINTPAASKKA